MSEYQKVRVLCSLDNPNEHDLICSKCNCLFFCRGRVKKFLESFFDYWKSIKWHCKNCGNIEETCSYINRHPSPPSPFL